MPFSYSVYFRIAAIKLAILYNGQWELDTAFLVKSHQSNELTHQLKWPGCRGWELY
uniref:Uncharacterized protein n=1 Tax=Anguilla anguilla TaxID=7936 RepID=A0A0E9PXK2_ANGAN